MKLQTKILSILFPLIVLPMLLVGYLAYHHVNSMAVNNAEDHIDTLLNQMRYHIKTHTSRANKNLTYIHDLPIFKQYIDANEHQRYSLFYRPLTKALLGFQESQKEYLEVKFVEANGTEDLVIERHPGDSPSSKEANPALYKKLKAQPHEHHAILSRRLNSKQGAIVFSKPVYDKSGDTIIGHLLLTMDLKFINEFPIGNMR